MKRFFVRSLYHLLALVITVSVTIIVMADTGRPEIPQESVVIHQTDHLIVYKKSVPSVFFAGLEETQVRVLFDARFALTPKVSTFLNLTHKTAATLTADSEKAIIIEGRHRATLAANGDKVLLSDGGTIYRYWLDYPYESNKYILAERPVELFDVIKFDPDNGFEFDSKRAFNRDKSEKLENFSCTELMKVAQGALERRCGLCAPR